MSPLLTALEPAIDRLVAVPVEQLCAAELQDFLTAVVAQRDRLDGVVSQAAGQLAAVTGGQVATDDGGSRSVVGWLAETTRTTPGTAGSRLRTAGLLRDLPLVVEAVLDGELTQEQAAVLARLLGRIPTCDVQDLQPQLIEVAAGRDPHSLGQWVAHLIATHCEPALDEDDRAAQARRHLTTSRAEDGSLSGRFRLAPEQAETFLTALEPLARRQGLLDSRDAGQRRADALTDLAEQVLRHGQLPEHGGHRPTISYVLPAPWAAAEQTRAGCPTCSSCPQHRPAAFADTVTASLPGQPGVPAGRACATGAWTGPATRAVVEALLCDARISRVLLDGTGQVHGLESLADTVTPRQRRALAARDGRCTARGCTRPPAVCDAHHLIRLSDGGDTALPNLVLLCRRHHVLWHKGKLRLADLHVPWHPDQQGTGADPPF